MPNLPAGTEKGKGFGIDRTFTVSHIGDLGASNPPIANSPPEMQSSTVHLKPGETSHVTVHVHNAAENTK